MKTKDKVKIECLKKGMTLAKVAERIGINRHNYYFHLNNETSHILRKTEKILELKEGFFSLTD